jgi:hypothetical protein
MISNCGIGDVEEKYGFFCGRWGLYKGKSGFIKGKSGFLMKNGSGIIFKV